MAIVNTFEQLQSTPSNLGGINLNSVAGDGAKYFNNFFNKTITISTAKDDAIVSFFEKYADNKQSALALASAVIYTSRSQNMDPMLVLDEFKKLEKGMLSAYLSYFLNLSRVGTSLLGVNNQTVKNKYVARTILA